MPTRNCGLTNVALSASPPEIDDNLQPTGLSKAEVLSRRANGQSNAPIDTTGATYGLIIRRNLITFINVTLFTIGVVLIALGQLKDAILTSSLVFITALIGVVQEVRAKRRLDEIALLSRVQTSVLRDGNLQKISPEDLVLGDVVELRPGSQVPLDGVVLVANGMAVDESLLTGEADLVEKSVGDPLYSGSFCVSGDGYLEVEKVGAASLAVTITAGARVQKTTLTPFQREVNSVVQILIAVAVVLFAVMMLQAAIFWHASFADSVTAAAVILGIVPPGLFLTITIAYSMAAVRLARQNALVQQANAIESLSHVDVFCMDKTGTLTSNRLEVAHLVPIGDTPQDSAHAWLGTFAVSVSGGTKTSEAIATACPGPAVVPDSIAPFTSARRWSGMTSLSGPSTGTFVLGAPEVILPFLMEQPMAAPDEWRSGGLRVLLFAMSPGQLNLIDDSGIPALPSGLHGAIWVALKDELRPHLQETLNNFYESNIALKIISGDNPETVTSLAIQAGFPEDARWISGDLLEASVGDEFGTIVEETTVFGRISPQLKERIVESLRTRGHYVAMTGDGVNDVLSLKKAQLGIAMESGSEATRAVADIVLLNDSFSALPLAFTEGQRIRSGLLGTLYLFLTRVFAVAIVMAMTAIFRLAFPFLPGHMTLLTVLTVGIPTFALALFATPKHPRGSTLRSVARFVAPAAIFTAGVALHMYTTVYFAHDLKLENITPAGLASSYLSRSHELQARDTLTYVLVLCGLWMVVFAAPPTKWFAVVEESNGDWRPTIVAILMLPLYATILAVPGLRGFFGVNLLDTWIYFAIAGTTVVWMLSLRWAWKSGIVDTILDSSATRYVNRAVGRVVRWISVLVEKIRPNSTAVAE